MFFTPIGNAAYISAAILPYSALWLLFLSGAGVLAGLAAVLSLPFWIPKGRLLLRALISKFRIGLFTSDQSLEGILKSTGFAYDPRQDIFYSVMNPWQREFGYCRLYDEAAAPLNMIIDSEPVHFDYAGKKWLIEFWKGQYGMTTGGEVGVFNTEKPDLDIPRFFTGTFYNSASDTERLPISFVLYRKNRPQFARSGRHWWLTGFVLGEFSEPSDLKMQIRVTFPETAMASAFVKALREIGYTPNEYYQNNTIVRVNYGKPHTSQPVSRIDPTDFLIQQKNKFLCDQYQELTKGIDSSPEKLEFTRTHSPRLFRQIIRIGKPKPLYKDYGKIQRTLKKSGS